MMVESEGRCMSELAERVSSRLRNSQTLRLVTVGILVLLLQIPVAMIGGQVSERKDRGEEAAAEVSAKWGGRQVLSGPMLVVPYLHTWTETSRNGHSVERTGFRHASFLPDELRIEANATSEIRKRGIFAVPVYRLDLTVAGRFSPPELSQLALEPAAMAWDRARLVVGISATRAIQQTSAVTRNGKAVPFGPGTAGQQVIAEAIQAPVGAGFEA